MIKEYRNNQEFESINEDIRNEVGSEKKKNWFQ